jgi:GNAT superfamily N-acetyltransferase
MPVLYIEPLDVDDPTSAQAVVDLYAAADAVDQPWHPAFSPQLIRTLAVHGWDDAPELFVLGRDQDGALVAAGSVVLPQRDNRHAALIEGRVHPQRRRRGLGTVLYDHLENVVTDAGRTRIFTGGAETPAARGFAVARGYALGSVGMHRQVDLGEVTAEQVQGVFDEAAPFARDYELVRHAGPLPDELLNAYVDAVSAINDAPLDDLDIDDEVYDADRVRYYEQGQLMSGRRLYRVLARHRSTGIIAGHTVVTVEADRPHLAHQHDTTVVSGHRGHRLGLLLKADMMQWLRDAEPALRTIGTQNAVSNLYMIDVNERLGYRVMGRSVEFQLDVPTAPESASSRGAGAVTGTA